MKLKKIDRLIDYETVCMIRKGIWESKLQGITRERAFEIAHESNREAMQAAKNKDDRLLVTLIDLNIKEMIEEIYEEDESIVKVP